MSQQFKFQVLVTAEDSVSVGRAREILKRIIDAGLTDASETLREGGGEGAGDVDAAKLAESLEIADPVVLEDDTSVPIKHWGCYGVDGTVDTHLLEVRDSRLVSGQAHMWITDRETQPDCSLSVMLEIHTDPFNGLNQVPCAHVHFNTDELAFSLFKIDSKILLVPEFGVQIEKIQPRDADQGSVGWPRFWIELIT